MHKKLLKTSILLMVLAFGIECEAVAEQIYPPTPAEINKIPVKSWTSTKGVHGHIFWYASVMSGGYNWIISANTSGFNGPPKVMFLNNISIVLHNWQAIPPSDVVTNLIADYGPTATDGTTSFNAMIQTITPNNCSIASAGPKRTDPVWICPAHVVLPPPPQGRPQEKEAGTNTQIPPKSPPSALIKDIGNLL